MFQTYPLPWCKIITSIEKKTHEKQYSTLIQFYSAALREDQDLSSTFFRRYV